MATQIIAGDSVSQASILGGNDGALILRTGPNGAKVDALKISAEGYPSFLKGTPAGMFEISASVASNNLTLTLLAGQSISYRSSSLSSGAIQTIQNLTSVSLIVPAGASLGTVNAVQSRIVVLALAYNGATELAAVNIAGGVDLSETGLISTTAISGTATSASTIYSTTARTNVPYRVVGVVDSTQATAGTWATIPSFVQGCGGQAASSMASIGYSQTWQSVTRAASTTYYNTTGRPIVVAISGYTGGAGGSLGYMSINGGTGIPFYGIYSSGGSYAGAGIFIVPAGASYNYSGYAPSTWFELR